MTPHVMTVQYDLLLLGASGVLLFISYQYMLSDKKSISGFVFSYEQGLYLLSS